MAKTKSSVKPTIWQGNRQPVQQAVAFSPCGRYLAAAGGESPRKYNIALWDATSGELIDCQLVEDSTATQVCFHPDGKRLITAGMKPDSIAVRDLSDLTRVTSIPAVSNYYIWDVSLSPDGKKLLVCSWDDCTYVVDLATGKSNLFPSTKGAEFGSALFSPAGKTIAAATAHEGRVSVLQATSGKCLTRFRAHDDNCCILAFSSDGQYLATGGEGKKRNGEIALWDTHTWKNVWKRNANRIAVHGGTFSCDDQYLATTGNDNVVMVFNVEEGKLIEKLTGPKNALFNGVSFASDAYWLAAADEKLLVWQLDEMLGAEEP
ncbi:WD40 repeat domain-containing protein [Blastopirellula sp. JC732]|uniref:WD40 repeat domain-containing protein n=1 Tax=Blastopirellula sediminis TaxID=2894196 RepID=A0A9X1MJ60_9BACT|nr:WD40 repeat domain-containing protein [Blastopirellula sediminis]MCC9609434.1 WD40 repeat domain-containing protein [Blastopirellula sediminis]MCC9627789.1 WD40 repeat domain-containing protein [Blastopirellula sediminis]